MPIDAARDLQLRAVDIESLIPRRQEVRVRQHPVGVGVQERHIHRPVFRDREAGVVNHSPGEVQYQRARGNASLR